MCICDIHSIYLRRLSIMCDSCIFHVYLLLALCVCLCTKVFTSVTAKFDDTNDFEGWNCGTITTCGKYGNVCGGYNTKAKGNDIKKTFEVPEGTYWVTLDFIKIDSWLVKYRYVHA